MTVFSWKRIAGSYSDKQPRGPKSAIQNLKSAGFFALVIAFVGLAGGVESQQPKKVPRIGYLSSGDAASEPTCLEGIRLALRELGYIEGQNIAIEYRYASGKRDRFPELAAELVRLKVDIIVVVGGNRIIPAATSRALQTLAQN